MSAPMKEAELKAEIEELRARVTTLERASVLADPRCRAIWRAGVLTPPEGQPPDRARCTLRAGHTCPHEFEGKRTIIRNPDAELVALREAIARIANDIDSQAGIQVHQVKDRLRALLR